ncbi:putative ribonuclease H-like domain-containing protein [Tanacetum coccineum]
MESQSETTQTVSALKLPILKTGDYDLWSMRMEQYLTHTDYALWEVIMNGDAPAIASASTEGPIPPKTAEQKLARKNELKAKSTMLLAIPDENLLKFHGIKDAKTLWEPIKARNNIALIMRNKADLDELSLDDLYNNLKVYEAEIKSQSSSSLNSQMFDKKNSVLFTKTECLVLSPDFKLLDESQVLLKVPRQNNMYSFDLKNVVPSGGLTCLFAKATIDESYLWHRRLGHINFKPMNKLVRGNLVRGLPSKRFKNDHTCVAYQKGKQYKASCKTKLVSSISQPVQMLHMDLFGPTFVRSINHKIYCLVVTNDYCRFSWVFFLATKDETSGILKTFITSIENQINHKVKIIRCDNRTEFKNNDMNQFCGKKGIKSEFSVARTPQQNGVAERKNRTLIEAARDMLADSLLPTTFWAEAVNTACYVQNRVLVTKPHNKTPYELLLGRPPSISFMRPFVCHVTILNTLDPLGKFDGKADEGFLVGYSINSKAFRVFNTRTRKVEENLHINFLENKPNVVGSGPEWLFDIDSLIKSMNYEPEKASDHEYILLPLMLSNSPLSSSSQSTDNKDADEVPGKGDDDLSEINGQEKEDGASNKEDGQHSSGPIHLVAYETVYKEWEDRMERAATTASSLEAEQDSGNINRTQSMATLNESFPQGTDSSSGPRVNTLRSGEDIMKLMELMEHCTKLSELFWQTASASTLENGDMEIIATIDGKVKVVSEASIRRHLKLEDSDGISTLPISNFFEQLALIGSDEGSMTLNELTVLCTTLSKKVETLESDLKQTKLTYGAAYTKLIMKVKKLEHIVKSSKARRRVRLVVSEDEDELEDPSKQGRKIAQIDEDEGFSLVQMSAQTQGRHEHDFEESDFEFIAPEEDYTAEPDISTANVPVSTAVQKLGLEEALRLQEQLDKEERQRIARVHEEANTFNAEEWDNIQAQIEADEELAHRLQAQERERYSEADKARLLVELINERKRKFTQQRAEHRRNKPMTQAQQRTYMCNYIKNMGSHTLQQLKKLSFDEVKELFETTMKRVNTFTPMESDDTVPKVLAGSSKIDVEQELNQEKEGMNVEALQTKYPIIDWEVYIKDSRKYWKIIRVVKLWSLVHERFNSIEPTKDKERELCVELKRLFEPDDDDTL